jgi:hypothetical protein
MSSDLVKARRALKKTYATQYKLDEQRTALRAHISALEARAPTEEQQQKKPSKKREREEPEEWRCAGDVVAGTPCATPGAAHATDTRHAKKTHNTCVTCKKSIKRSRKEAHEQRVPVEDGEEDLGAPLQMEPEEDA